MTIAPPPEPTNGLRLPDLRTNAGVDHRHLPRCICFSSRASAIVLLNWQPGHHAIGGQFAARPHLCTMASIC